jgi:hypothetical protein
MKGILGVSFCIVLAGLAGAARADIVNGDFSQGSDGLYGWNPPMCNGSASAVVQSGQLQLTASNTYQWNEDRYSLVDTESRSEAAVSQDLIAAPAGATALQFRASATYGGATIIGTPLEWSTGPVAYVSVADLLGNEVDSQSVGSDGLYSLSLAGLDLSNLTVRFYVTSDISNDIDLTGQAMEPEQGSRLDVAVTATFGDVRFGVPEPVTLSLLALGGTAILRRRRAA